MKLLLDQGLPRSAVQLLETAGFDAVHVGEIGHATSSDAEILDLARTQSRILVALDADFHRLLAITEAVGPSVVRIRIEGLKAPALAELLVGLLPQFEDELHEGCVLTVRPSRIGMRTLPLLSRTGS